MNGAQLGIKTIIHQNQVIGSYTMIGMGSIVTKKKKLLPGYIFFGKPVKKKGINKIGLKDAFREKCIKTDIYTWWSNRGNAYDNNVGWRIDYQMVTDNFCNKIKSASVYKANKFSDHAPLIVNYDI